MAVHFADLLPPECLLLIAYGTGDSMKALALVSLLSKQGRRAARDARVLLIDVRLDHATDTAVTAVAHGCPQLETLGLNYCDRITDAAVAVVHSRCKQLRNLTLLRGGGR